VVLKVQFTSKIKTENSSTLGLTYLHIKQKRYIFRNGNVFFQALNRDKNGFQKNYFWDTCLSVTLRFWSPRLKVAEWDKAFPIFLTSSTVN